MRLQLDIPKEREAEFHDLIAKTGSKDAAALVNHALSFLELCLEERQAGHKIASIDPATKNYKTLNFLSEAKRSQATGSEAAQTPTPSHTQGK
ncbi:MAG: hypothetical protein PW734_09640 [Verrucomicrobium sp.]|nr:hypothetical protein [Verrucomicrobium sp.]